MNLEGFVAPDIERRYAAAVARRQRRAALARHEARGDLYRQARDVARTFAAVCAEIGGYKRPPAWLLNERDRLADERDRLLAALDAPPLAA